MQTHSQGTNGFVWINIVLKSKTLMNILERFSLLKKFKKFVGWFLWTMNNSLIRSMARKKAFSWWIWLKKLSIFFRRWHKEELRSIWDKARESGLLWIKKDFLVELFVAIADLCHSVRSVLSVSVIINWITGIRYDSVISVKLSIICPKLVITVTQKILNDLVWELRKFKNIS